MLYICFSVYIIIYIYIYIYNVYMCELYIWFSVHVIMYICIHIYICTSHYITILYVYVYIAC